MAEATTRVATGRRATPASPSIGGGSEDRTRTPVWAFRFRDGCRRLPSAGPSSHHVVRRAGLEPARPRGDLVYRQAGQPIAQPTHVPQRWHPRRLRRGSLRRQETAPAVRVRLLPDAVHYRVRPHSPSLGSESGEVSPRPCDREPGATLLASLSARSRVRCPWDLPRFAWTEGIEPPAAGFGDRCSSS